jgi:hypothetical protein
MYKKMFFIVEYQLLNQFKNVTILRSIFTKMPCIIIEIVSHQ